MPSCGGSVSVKAIRLPHSITTTRTRVTPRQTFSLTPHTSYLHSLLTHHPPSPSPSSHPLPSSCSPSTRPSPSTDIVNSSGYYTRKSSHIPAVKIRLCVRKWTAGNNFAGSPRLDPFVREVRTSGLPQVAREIIKGPRSPVSEGRPATSRNEPVTTMATATAADPPLPNLTNSPLDRLHRTVIFYRACLLRLTNAMASKF
ncbi:hypothetical protein E2C01_030435 [Portunus trituberculatus]|uniref:Uncharacterized protein n=1 Tax=Portunus trituberculatus TaxID=210409 RepID=A0A5B7ES25_PORTR|nr:hypothetical protein [Portunus trituberculatus]